MASQYRFTGVIWEPGYYHQDALGSTMQLTDDGEDVTDTWLYDAWGEVLNRTGTTENPFEWIGAWGYYKDEATGLYYVRRRNYRASTGRWTKPDPLLFVDGPNLYFAYFVPNGVDPSGLLGGWGYGNWCGFSRAGQNGPPIDALDAACKKHDYCVPTWSTACFNWLPCAATLCVDAYEARKRGCASSWPSDAARREACKSAAYQVEVLFCAQSLVDPAVATGDCPASGMAKSAYPCFSADTLVWGEKGLLAISSVDAGCRIFGYDVRVGKLTLTTVDQVLIHRDGEFLINVIVADEDYIEVTDGHPLFDGETWVLAHEFDDRDFLTVRSGNKVSVKKLTDVPYRRAT